MLGGRAEWCFSLAVFILYASVSPSVGASISSYAAGSGTMRSDEPQDGRRPSSLQFHRIPVRLEASAFTRQTLQQTGDLGTSRILQKAVNLNSQEEKTTASAAAKVCSYTVRIKTSCSSPRVTKDAVSLAFGDVYKNEVYAARLDNPSSGTFGRCSMDTFKIQGPCGGETCYLYLRRIGRDGWTPDWVKVTYSSYARDAEFDYGSPLPNAVWYGFDFCGKGRADG